MARRYTLDGIPSDLLSSEKFDVRRLKTEIVSAPISKSFTYNEAGDVATIVETNTVTNESITKTFIYSNGNLINIEVS